MRTALALLLALLLPRLALATTPDRLFLPVELLFGLDTPARQVLAEVRRRVDPAWVAALSPTVAVGRIEGRLLFGKKMEPSPGIYLRNPNEAWGTTETINALRSAHAWVAKKHPGGADMVVGDLSMRTGGRFPPHHTHRNGLDVDLRYYQLGVAPGFHDLVFISPENFDAPRVFTLVETLYKAGQAEVIYIDAQHQKALYHYARGLGLNAAYLRPILSYPDGTRREDALVQHAKGHYNHIHIRFVAPWSRLTGALWTEDEAMAMQRAADLRLMGHFDHVVASGENLGAIARKHNVTVADLLRWNQLGECARINAGQSLKILTPTPYESEYAVQ